VSGAVNEFTGQKSNYSVTLTKYEKDFEGNISQVKITGAEFYLYQVLSKNPETIQQIGGRYETDENGVIQVDNLKSGSYFFLETNPSYGYDYDLDTDGASLKNRYEFEVTSAGGTGSASAKVHAYNRKTTADLEVEKTVENRDGTVVSEEQKEQSFEFTITFGDGKTYQYKIGDGAPQTLGAGGTFTLKHGEKANFLNVPVGIQYTVVETPTEESQIISENHTGNVKANGAKASFTNLQGPAGYGSLVISKTVTGGGGDEAFTFTVTLGQDADQDYSYDLYDSTGKIGEGSIKTGQTITLKSGQWAVITRIPIGTDYEVAEEEKEDYTATLDTQKGQIIPGKNEAPFVNQKHADEETGKLIVTKTVTAQAGGTIDTDKVFEFHIQVGTGVYTCYLRHGETYEIANIPVGTQYEVVEKDYYAEGYVTSSNNSNATIAAGDNIAAFTNEHIELPVEEKEGSLTVQKKVVNGESNKNFIFYVTIGNNQPEIVILKDGESKTYTGIPAGTHYQVKEADYYTDGYILTSEEATGTIVEEGKTALFTNTAQDRGKGSLVITKVVSGAGETDKEFTFQVTFSDGGDYTYVFDDGIPGTSDEEKQEHHLKNGKLTLKHGQRAAFLDLPDGIRYTVTEEPEADYLQSITDQEGTIAGDIETKVPHNNYKESRERETLIRIKKVTVGEGADLNKSFDFILQIDGEEHEFSLANGEEKEFKIPVGSTYSLEEKPYIQEGYLLESVIRGYGTAGREEVEIIATNRYVGTVFTEVSGEKTWIVPDGVELPESITVYLMHGDRRAAEQEVTAKSDWKYTFTDVPKYDSEGEEIAYSVAEKDSDHFIWEADGMNLVNTYVEAVTSAVPQVTKQISVEGEGNAAEATFTFTMEGLNGAPMPEDANGNRISVQRNGTGSISFGNIDYTLPGKYVYEIRETVGNSEGYSYDTNVYEYTVEVTLENGKLYAEKSITKNGVKADAIIFTNIYVPQTGEETSLTVNKVWAGTTNPDQPASVSVQLYQNGTAYGHPITLSAENNWVHTWVGLNKTDTWTVDESEVPADYTKVVTENGRHGYTIINTYTPDGGDGGDNSGGGNGGGGSTTTGGKTTVTTPKTDDPDSMVFWFAVLILSIIGLRISWAGTGLFGRKKEKQE